MNRLYHSKNGKFFARIESQWSYFKISYEIAVQALITAGSGGHLRHWELGPAQDAGTCCDLRGVRASLEGGPESFLHAGK